MPKQRIRGGATPAGSTDWQSYEGQMPGIYVDVNTSLAGFTTTAHYVASLAGKTHHWLTTGGSCIYNPTATGFRIYVRFWDSSAENMTPEFANEAEWHITWVGVED